MRFGKVKAHAGQACRVSKVNGWIFLVLGKPAFSLLLLWAAFWSIHIVVKSNAFAQDIPLALTTPAIQSAIKDNDAYTHAWWSEVHELSTNGALRKSEIAYASDRRLGNTLFRDRNQFVSRPFTGKCHAKGDGSTTEKNISATPGAPNTEDQVLSKYGSRSPTKGYADSPRYSLLAIGDWFRVTTSLGATVSRTPSEDRLFVSDETSLVDGAPIASEKTIAPPTPLLIMHLGSYDLPVALSEPQLGDSER
jgi:hypothetical protein